MCGFSKCDPFTLASLKCFWDFDHEFSLCLHIRKRTTVWGNKFLNTQWVTYIAVEVSPGSYSIG